MVKLQIKYLGSLLTHWGRNMHIYISKLTIIGSDNCLLPSHFLNQCWNIVNWTLKNKYQWHFSRNSNIFIKEIAFENFILKSSHLFQPQCVNNKDYSLDKWLQSFPKKCQNFVVVSLQHPHNKWYTVHHIYESILWIQIVIYVLPL